MWDTKKGIRHLGEALWQDFIYIDMTRYMEIFSLFLFPFSNRETFDILAKSLTPGC